MQLFATKRAAVLERSKARKIFSIIGDELALVEAEFERQMRSNLQVIDYLGAYLRESGGKRVRPALLVLSNYAAGGRAAEEPVIRLAAVMEMLHTATLVHDDIIDNADIRRGRASVNARFGNQTAVLMGDWLYMSAFETSLRERSLEILDILTRLTRKMTEGELIQLTTIGDVTISEEAYYDILRRKTAYLFSACCEIGSIAGGADPAYREALRDYGMDLGIAFQLADDLLDLTAEMDDLGKASGVDLTEGKMTLPLILLLKEKPELKPVLEGVMRSGSYDAISQSDLYGQMAEVGMIERIRAIALDFASSARKNLEVLPKTEYRLTLEAIPNYVIERGS
jgi:octaprenyl-diphosphate synthase